MRPMSEPLPLGMLAELDRQLTLTSYPNQAGFPVWVAVPNEPFEAPGVPCGSLPGEVFV